MKRSPSLPRAIARAQVSASPTAVASVSVGCQRRRDNSRRHGAQFTVGNWDGPGHFGIGIIKTIIHINNINDKLLPCKLMLLHVPIPHMLLEISVQKAAKQDGFPGLHTA